MPTLQTTPTALVEANLARLRCVDPALADVLSITEPIALDVQPSRSGPASASVEHDGRRVTLASRYDPLAEARKIASDVDHGKHAVIVVLGFGLGYHVAHIAQRLSDDAALIIFEPDRALLRAALEQVDHTAWLGKTNVLFADTSMDRGKLLVKLDNQVGVLTHGVILVTHPPSRMMHGDTLAAFSKVIADAVSYARMHVATALVNSSRTVRNVTCAMPWYAAGDNTNDLLNAAKGYPAVCVGAGPSLARNVGQLCDPAVRRRVVVISAQTTLKPLLDRGIRPDFVTALDYSEISRRFYESLPPLDGVTLVAEPKAHPTIFDHFRAVKGGAIRVTNNGFLSQLLGEAAPAITPIRDGATVAHLSFYLAQHLGCDPVIFIGQDLGFSDGLYYCPGTAIHDVWAPELGAFNTVETMEWQRIVRHRTMLQKSQDVHGQPIYTDEQMATYLGQFERDFEAAPQQIIDASEGGMSKRGSQRMPLADALRTFATRDVPALPQANGRFDRARLDAAIAQMQQRIEDVRELRRTSERTIPVLKRMLKHQDNRAKMERLFEEIQPLTQRAEALNGTLNLINQLNTIGSFRRARADRAIEHIDPTTCKREPAMERQRRQIKRDIENIDWIRQTCDEALTIFQEALTRANAIRDEAG